MEDRTQELEETIADLRGRLAYFETRSQRILDLLAQKCLAALESPDPLSSNMMSVIRQFLRDQGIIDLRNGASPVNHLAKQYRFTPKQEGDDTIEVAQ